jgi:hypothetical protein
MATDLLNFPRSSDDVLAIAGDSVRAPTLQRGENYIQALWGKKKTFRIVTFLGIGTSLDTLIEKAPRIKDLTTDQRYFFNQVNDAGEIETVGLGMSESVLSVVDGDNWQRVTFLKIKGEDYPAIVVAPKAPRAPKVAATTENGEVAPKAKRGRKPKVVATEAETALVPLDGDVTDATIDPSVAEQPETDDRVAA